MNSEIQALLAEHNKIITDFANYILKIGTSNLNRTLSDGSGSTYRAVLAHTVRHGYDYLVWVQRAAGLHLLVLPGDVGNLGSVDNDRLLGLLSFLPNYAKAALSGLRDSQLDGKAHKTELGNLTVRQIILQMNEHILKHQAEIHLSEGK